MAARQAEGFESTAFYPFEDGALADLAIGGDVAGGESDVTSFVPLHNPRLLCEKPTLRRGCFW